MSRGRDEELLINVPRNAPPSDFQPGDLPLLSVVAVKRTRKVTVLLHPFLGACLGLALERGDAEALANVQTVIRILREQASLLEAQLPAEHRQGAPPLNPRHLETLKTWYALFGVLMDNEADIAVLLRKLRTLRKELKRAAAGLEPV